MSLNNSILLAALFVAAGVAGFLYYDYANDQSDSSPESAHAAAVGQLRPVFALPDLTGTERDIREWDGQATIVNFWATWCPPCRREIPILIDLQDEAEAAGIAIIGIAMDQFEAVSDYAQQTPFNYPILVGEQGAVDAATGYGADVVGLPLTVMTNRHGEVVGLHAGELSRDDLEAAIAQLSTE